MITGDSKKVVWEKAQLLILKQMERDVCSIFVMYWFIICTFMITGDSKEVVREKAQLLILKLMERDVITPQGLFEKLTPAFSHKNGKIREEVMNCLQTTLTE